MSKKKETLKLDKNYQPNKLDQLKIGIIVSNWNTNITSLLFTECINTLLKNGVLNDNIRKIEVPGAFELPLAARILLTSEKMDAVICLGCVIKGKTNHDDYINQSVATGITQLGLTSSKPIIFGVLTVLNEQQALDRANGTHGNKGAECAITALHMISIKQNFNEPKTKIGFS